MLWRRYRPKFPKLLKTSDQLLRAKYCKIRRWIARNYRCVYTVCKGNVFSLYGCACVKARLTLSFVDRVQTSMMAMTAVMPVCMVTSWCCVCHRVEGLRPTDVMCRCRPMLNNRRAGWQTVVAVVYGNHRTLLNYYAEYLPRARLIGYALLCM